ncbi:hypothetical protein D9C73_023570 [Collichthys lucidus]|uniref:Uncharacterized protein n=1 Tax=Collichthys lucidus TaxID=240159 RepID=A0A4U5VQH6_COLLU|nr:hypothetical protein D9C73_023570 [Collichthys lucidus]
MLISSSGGSSSRALPPNATQSNGDITLKGQSLPRSRTVITAKISVTPPKTGGKSEDHPTNQQSVQE